MSTLTVLLTLTLTFTLTLAMSPPPTPVSKPSKPVLSKSACRAQSPLICILSPTLGNNVVGKILFTPVFRKKQCLVRIEAKLTGLTNRMHGFHIHVYGDISNSTGASTGGHFTNPEGLPINHGLPDDDVRHWGDFGNLRNRKGIAKYNRIDRVITLKGIVGRGITVHAAMDQGADAQPTGASGARVAFGVIGFANPSSLSL